MPLVFSLGSMRFENWPSAPKPGVKVYFRSTDEGRAAVLLQHDDGKRGPIDWSRFKPGDHLTVSRGLYLHHGIYEGGGSIIHYHKGADGVPMIRSTSVDEFVLGAGKVNLSRRPVAGREADVLAKARSRLGESEYNLNTNNCEHFARDSFRF